VNARQMIEFLSSVDPDAEILRIPARSSGVSDRVYPRAGEGAKSRYGYILPLDGYFGARAVEELRSKGEVRQVVWL
jgi:hypothetical protein